MSDALVHESLSIFVARQGLISEFLTANDFILVAASAPIAGRYVFLKNQKTHRFHKAKFIMSIVTAILFGRTCWANVLVGSELSSNNRRFSGWTQCYPSNFCEPHGKLHKFLRYSS